MCLIESGFVLRLEPTECGHGDVTGTLKCIVFRIIGLTVLIEVHSFTLCIRKHVLQARPSQECLDVKNDRI